MIISSQQNPIFKKLRTLLSAKGIKEHNQFLMAGARLTQEYVNRDIKNDYCWVMRSDQKAPEPQAKNTITLARELFEVLDEAGSHHPLLCVDLPKFKNFSELNPDFPAIYCTVGDPANLGAILRSASAFGIRQIVLLAEACHPFLPKSVRSSAGYVLDLDYYQGPPARELESGHLMALDAKGESYWNVELGKNLHFLIGEEGQGVPRSFSGTRVSIPMSPKVESLNAAVAASLLLAEWKRRQ